MRDLTAVFDLPVAVDEDCFGAGIMRAGTVVALNFVFDSSTADESNELQPPSSPQHAANVAASLAQRMIRLGKRIVFHILLQSPECQINTPASGSEIASRVVTEVSLHDWFWM